MVKSKYTFVDYSAEWPAQFERYAATVRNILGENVLELHHIGSTSVPGLAAKPIIDMLPLVADINLVESRKDQMNAAGFHYWGEYGLIGRRYFSKDCDGTRIINCHIYQIDNPERIRHLAFPAFLRAHDAVRDEYAAIKRKAIAAHPDDINAYNDHKNDWIQHHQKLAVEWYLANL